jgi:hypothetical protein
MNLGVLIDSNEMKSIKKKIRKPRGKMPPPTKVFPDRKKEKSRKACRGKNHSHESAGKGS